MYIPSQSQWQIVIDKLYSILPLTFEAGDQHLDMLETTVNRDDESCGTVHCVGGWYAIAHWRHEAINREKILYFSDGADALARDLGFPDSGSLEYWARIKPELWGNKLGGHMFALHSAYAGAKTISDIINHFERVKYNCLVYEQKNKRATAP